MPLPPAAPLHIRPSVRRELETLVSKPTAPQRAVRRAWVLLDAADGISNAEISRQRKIAREHVILIRRRFEERGVESVYRDAAGRGRPKEMSEEVAAKIITTTMQTTPKNATHWTADEMARRLASAVVRFIVFGERITYSPIELRTSSSAPTRIL